MKKLTLLGISLSFSTGLALTAHAIHHDKHDAHGHGGHESEQAANSSYTQFPSVGFEQKVELEIPYGSEQVCPLFEPTGRHLIYEWWAPTTLREPEADTLVGHVEVATFNHEGERDIFLTVTKHEPEDGYIQYLVLWDDFELQRIDITCVSTGKSETKVTWLERNAGLHDNGVFMVSKFVEEGHLERVVQRYADRATKHLENKSL